MYEPTCSWVRNYYITKLINKIDSTRCNLQDMQQAYLQEVKLRLEAELENERLEDEINIVDGHKYELVGDLNEQAAEIERLTNRLNQIASIAHASGKSMTENRALAEIRKLSLPYWEDYFAFAPEEK